MKLKFLMIIAIAGFAIAGCSSTKNTDGTTDTTLTDTSAGVVDTTKTPDTTKTLPPDTTKN